MPSADEILTRSLGFGQPVCYNSETCLFTAATDGYLYEGCGQTSIAYNWVTECWPYPQIGIAPISQIYCPASAPDCGFFAFQFDESNTYYNFGCSTISYSLYVDLLSTTDAGASQTLVLAGGGTTSITETAPVTVTDTVRAGTSTSTPAVVPGLKTGTATSQASSAASSTSLPTINSHSSKSTPIGGIVGGVVGGIAVIALLAFLLWFVLRKRRQDRAATQAHESQVQQQQADAATAAAFHNNNRVSEIAGTMKPMHQAAGAFAPVTYTGQENGNGNEKLMAQQVNEYPSPTPQSPPPMYAQPHPQQQPPAPTSPYPPSNYTELENQNLQPGSERTSVQPASPMGTGTGTFSSANELSGSNTGTYQPPVSPQPNVQQAYQVPPNAQQQLYQPQPNIQVQQQPYQTPQNVQEMSGNTPSNIQQQPYQPPPNVQQQPYQPPANIQEMSGNAASVRPMRPSGGFDMSGAPMSEDFGHHELP
jgi:hypothetical protein